MSTSGIGTLGAERMLIRASNFTKIQPRLVYGILSVSFTRSPSAEGSEQTNCTGRRCPPELALMLCVLLALV